MICCLCEISCWPDLTLMTWLDNCAEQAAQRRGQAGGGGAHCWCSGSIHFDSNCSEKNPSGSQNSELRRFVPSAKYPSDFANELGCTALATAGSRLTGG